MYLIFPTEEAAIERADEEGKDNNFSYWTEGKGTRWLTKPVPTVDGLWALNVDKYELDDLEQTTVTEDVVFLESTDDPE